MATDTAALTGPRWSSAVTCTRRAVYEGLDAPQTEPTEYQQAVWDRGAAWDKLMAAEIAAEHDGDVDLQAEIPWPKDDPVGTGHADVVTQDGTVYEVVSNQGCGAPKRKILQGCGYALAGGHSRVVVTAVDPLTRERKDHEFDPNDYRGEIEAIQRQVVDGLRGGALPQRVCRHPGEAVHRFCLFAEHCFAGWERPPVDEVFGNDALAEALADAEEEYTLHSKAAKEAEKRRNEIREQLRPFLDVDVEAKAGTVYLRVGKTNRWSVRRAEVV